MIMTNLLNSENVYFFILFLVKVVKKSEKDAVVIIACGVLVHEALKAA